MGKKNKDEAAPNPGGVSNRDILQRLNFLYQAGVYLSSISGDAPMQSPAVHCSGGSKSDDVAKKAKHNLSNRKVRSKRRRPTKPIGTSDLARTYVKTMKNVGQRTVVKMDPTVKRTLCKVCDTVLIPGSTATVRVKSSSSHGHTVTYTCLACQTYRRIPAPPTLNSDDTPVTAGASGFNATMEPTADSTDTMDVESCHQQNKAKPRQKRKMPLVARLPPFFERDIGHVVYRGNEKLEQPINR